MASSFSLQPPILVTARRTPPGQAHFQAAPVPTQTPKLATADKGVGSPPPSESPPTETTMTGSDDHAADLHARLVQAPTKRRPATGRPPVPDRKALPHGPSADPGRLTEATAPSASPPRPSGNPSH